MEKTKIKKIIKYTFLLGLFLVVLGTSYALFSITLTGRKKTRIKTASLKLELLDKNNNSIVKNNNNEYEYEINLENVVPEEDESGLSKDGFVFKLRNSGSIAAKYTIYLDDVELEQGEERILDQYVKYSLTKNETVGTPSLLSTLTERALDTGIINNGDINEYTLKIWIDKEADNNASNKVFNTVLRVKGEQYISKMNIKSGTFADTLQKQGIVNIINSVAGDYDSSKEQDGLYDYTDSEGTETYVYRGVNPNNYVTFAGSTWRALRIQEDGTVKLIKEDALNFESDRATESEGNHKNVIYNVDNGLDDNSNYAGSNIKSYVEEWYSSEMNGYNDSIITNSYCSDKTTDNNSQYFKFLGNDNNNKVYGLLNRTYFGNWDGNGEPTEEQMAAMWFKPSISCRTEDKVNAKVALTTVDEYALAGGAAAYNGNSSVSNYLSKNYIWWTMSPGGTYQSEDSMSIYVNYIYNNGMFNPGSVDYPLAVRPVITLKSNITASSGNGTQNNPYVIE